MHTGLEVVKTNTAPFSPPSAVRAPNPATHPDKLDTTAALHMASLADAFRSHSGCPPPPNPRLRHSIVQDMYQRIFDRGGP
jgi:hypothetical protein